MSDLTGELAESFRRFPGIGPRQAKRFVYYLLHAPNGAITKLVNQISELKKGAKRCPDCGRFYFLEFNNKNNTCAICSDTTREQNILMLVEKDIDLENVQKSGTFNGQFFVLGSLVKILDKEPVASVSGPELLKRVEKLQPQEIIVALSATPEGDNTVEFLKSYLEPILVKNKIKLSVLGRGLSTGVELEYSDSETLKSALKHREAP